MCGPTCHFIVFLRAKAATAFSAS